MNTEFLEKFLRTYRPSGFEKDGAEVFVNEATQFSHVETEFTDRMWNACVSIGSPAPDALKVLNTGAPFLADKLYDLRVHKWNEALTYLGISNVTIEKKERLMQKKD